MNIGIIGGGNMGEAIARGLLKNEMLDIPSLVIAEIKPERQKFLIEALPGATITTEIEKLISAVDIIILAVKPQLFPEILQTLKSKSISNKVFISIAAGISSSYIEEILGPVEVARAMPNTPALIGEGITAISRGAFLQQDSLSVIKSILSSIGDVVEVHENLMDAVTALTGSGPAYIFLFMEAMISVAEKLGLDKDTAEKMILKLFSGTSKLAFHSQDTPDILREKVTSPGGTTEKALEVLAEREFIAIIEQAVKAAQNRSKELSKK